MHPGVRYIELNWLGFGGTTFLLALLRDHHQQPPIIGATGRASFHAGTADLFFSSRPGIDNLPKV